VLGERRWLWVGAVWSMVAGCYVKGEPYAEPETSACEPLVAVEAPIELGTIIGMGEAGDGTVYLMDEVAPDFRVFVSVGSELRRARVSGTSLLFDEGLETYLSTVEQGGTSFKMGVESSATATRIAIGPSAERSFEALVELGEELSVVPESVLDDFVLRNLPGDVEIEYIASVETGERLVVIRPTDDWTYDDFRLFIGETERLIERQITSVERARDGGSTWIRFDFAGEEAEVSFPRSLTGTADPPTLTTGTGTYAVELLPPEDVTSFSFECLASRQRTNSPPPDGGA
jgi:hypothetical protein